MQETARLGLSPIFNLRFYAPDSPQPNESIDRIDTFRISPKGTETDISRRMWMERDSSKSCCAPREQLDSQVSHLERRWLYPGVRVTLSWNCFAILLWFSTPSALTMAIAQGAGLHGLTLPTMRYTLSLHRLISRQAQPRILVRVALRPSQPMSPHR